MRCGREACGAMTSQGKGSSDVVVNSCAVCKLYEEEKR